MSDCSGGMYLHWNSGWIKISPCDEVYVPWGFGVFKGIHDLFPRDLCGGGLIEPPMWVGTWWDTFFRWE